MYQFTYYMNYNLFLIRFKMFAKFLCDNDKIKKRINDDTTQK